MIGVIAKHRARSGTSSTPTRSRRPAVAARRLGRRARQGRGRGFRDAQATVLAPTGTMSFMMDCDTTGVEPELSLVKSKKLVGGGEITIVNRTVPMALDKLGYTPSEMGESLRSSTSGTRSSARRTQDRAYPVFDCAIGERAIHYMGHVKMMGAVQPFISGAISKTVNLPEEATVEEISQLLIESWQLGVKAIAIYRDNCKVAQPLSGYADKASRVADDRPVAPATLPAARFRWIASRSAVSSTSATTRATSTSACTRTARPRHLRRHREGRHDYRRPYELVDDLRRLGLQYGVPPEVYVSKFATCASSRAGSPTTPTSAWRSRSSTTSSAGSRRSSRCRSSRRRRGSSPRRSRRGSRRGMRRARRRRRRGGPVNGPARPLQHLGGRGRVREVRRPDGAHGQLLHVPRLRHEHRLS